MFSVFEFFNFNSQCGIQNKFNVSILHNLRHSGSTQLIPLFLYQYLHEYGWTIPIDISHIKQILATDLNCIDICNSNWILSNTITCILDPLFSNLV